MNRYEQLNLTALQANTGLLFGNGQNGDIQFQTLASPDSEWSQRVDAIEAPFASDYDVEEYEQNQALTIMGGYEMMSVLASYGVPISPFGIEKQITQLTVEQPLKGKRFLDIGCGPGRFVIALAALGARVDAFDATAEYVQITGGKIRATEKTLGRTCDVNLYQCPAERFDYGQKKYDGITSMFGVLNHVQGGMKLLPKIAQSIKPGGAFNISMYGPNSALVFDLAEDGKINGYKPSILQKRAEGGIILGDSDEVLPASFPTPVDIGYAIGASGLKINSTTGMLRVAALFPRDPDLYNNLAFLEQLERVEPEATKQLSPFVQDPNKLLLKSFLYDLRNQEKINDFAYFQISATKL